MKIDLITNVSTTKDTTDSDHHVRGLGNERMIKRKEYIWSLRERKSLCPKWLIEDLPCRSVGKSSEREYFII